MSGVLRSPRGFSEALSDAAGILYIVEFIGLEVFESSMGLIPEFGFKA